MKSAPVLNGFERIMQNIKWFIPIFYKIIEKVISIPILNSNHFKEEIKSILDIYTSLIKKNVLKSDICYTYFLHNTQELTVKHMSFFYCVYQKFSSGISNQTRYCCETYNKFIIFFIVIFDLYNKTTVLNQTSSYLFPFIKISVQ